MLDRDLEILGRVGAVWHILPHSGTNAMNTTDAACGDTIRAEELGYHAQGAHLFLMWERHRGNHCRRLCEACKTAPARAEGLQRWRGGGA